MSCQTQGSVRGDRAFALDDLGHARDGHVKIEREPIDTGGSRFHEILIKHFAWMNRRQLFRFAHRALLSMIVDNLDRESVVAPPDEANTELVVDPNAVLATPVALERFESVARQRQVVQPPG